MCGKDFIFVFSNFVFHSNLSFTNVTYYTQKGKITCHREIYQSVSSECAIGNQSLHYISFESYWVWDVKIKKSTFVISSIWQIQVHFGYSLDVRSGRGNVQLVGYSCKLNPLHLYVHSDWIRFSFFSGWCVVFYVSCSGCSCSHVCSCVFVYVCLSLDVYVYLWIFCVTKRIVLGGISVFFCYVCILNVFSGCRGDLCVVRFVHCDWMNFYVFFFGECLNST